MLYNLFKSVRKPSKIRYFDIESLGLVKPNRFIGFEAPFKRCKNIRISALWKQSARKLEQRWYRD